MKDKMSFTRERELVKIEKASKKSRLEGNCDNNDNNYYKNLSIVNEKHMDQNVQKPLI